MIDAADTPLVIDRDLLTRVARVAEPHHHALLQSIRREFGDENAATLHAVALFMLAGTVLKVIPNADRAPAGVAQVWATMGVPFTLEARRLQ